MEPRGPAKKLLSFSSWLSFIKRVDLIGLDLSERDAALSFVWARTCVAEPYSEKGALRTLHLPFEGFLEALCRVAALKALPDDDMLEEGGFANAGVFLCTMRENDPERFTNFVMQRRGEWGCQPKQQPLGRSVHHLISYLLHKIESGTRGDDDMALDEKEVNLFLGKSK